MPKQQTDSPLARAIAQQSAEWLESNQPAVYDALLQELNAGKSIADVKRILRRSFGTDLRDAFVLRVLQAAEYLTADGR